MLRKTIKALLIACLIIWLPLIAKQALSAPLTIQDASYADAMGSEVWGILVKRCEYKPSVCGWKPFYAPPPEKPRHG